MTINANDLADDTTTAINLPSSINKLIPLNVKAETGDREHH